MAVIATVVITTKNRKDELARAVESALAQTAGPEVLVIDDGSTDGTAEMVRQRFPAARVERSEQSLGLVVQRNRAAELATGDVIFSIDDDAALVSPVTIEQTLTDFDHPRVGAVAIPYQNILQSSKVMQQPPDPRDRDGRWICDSYIGTAHAVRRDVFRRLGGYRGYIFHQGEERDLCVRMLDAGYVVRLGRADPIHHFESPRRDLTRMDLFGRRNDVLFGWHNAPGRFLLPYLAATTLNGVMFGFRVGRLGRMLRGLAHGYAAILHEWSQRRPIHPTTFRLYRRLRAAQALLLEEIERDLPPMRRAED